MHTPLKNLLESKEGVAIVTVMTAGLAHITDPDPRSTDFRDLRARLLSEFPEIKMYRWIGDRDIACPAAVFSTGDHNNPDQVVRFFQAGGNDESGARLPS